MTAEYANAKGVEGNFEPALDDAEIAAWAVEYGVLAVGEPLSDGLRALVLQVVDYCAGIGEGYSTEEGNAGEHIRAAFGL